MNSNKIVAVDGSSQNISVSLGDMNSLLESSAYEDLLPLIESMLLQKRSSWKDVDAIILTTGPGSFTNIRLVASIVNAIKSVYNHIKIFTISSARLMNEGGDVAIRMTKSSLVLAHISETIDYELVDSYDGYIFKVSEKNDRNLARVAMELFKLSKDMFLEVDFVYELDYCGEIFAYKKKDG